MVQLIIQPIQYQNICYMHGATARNIGLPKGGSVKIFAPNKRSVVCMMQLNNQLPSNIIQISQNILGGLNYFQGPITVISNVPIQGAQPGYGGQQPNATQSPNKKLGFKDRVKNAAKKAGDAVKKAADQISNSLASKPQQGYYQPRPGHPNQPRPGYPNQPRPGYPNQPRPGYPNQSPSSQPKNYPNKQKMTPAVVLKKLKDLFNISNRIKIEDVIAMVGWDRTELFELFIDEKYHLSMVKIDGDYFEIVSKDDLSGLISSLDDEYDSWGDNSAPAPEPTSNYNPSRSSSPKKEEYDDSEFDI
jgi:hypothetical protein